MALDVRRDERDAENARALREAARLPAKAVSDAVDAAVYKDTFLTAAVSKDETVITVGSPSPNGPFLRVGGEVAKIRESGEARR